MSDKKEFFINCSCHAEGLLISKFDKNEIYISFYSSGINPKNMNFLSKLRYIWQVLIKSKPFEDQIVLNNKELKKLISGLKSL